MSIAPDLLYTRSHEWVRVEGEQATVGITHHAQDQLGDVVFVELPEVGVTVTRGETFGVVESVKAVSDLYSPVSGAVSEVNAALEDAPESINDDSYGEGWILKVALSDAATVAEGLMSASEYGAFIEGEGH